MSSALKKAKETMRKKPKTGLQLGGDVALAALLRSGGGVHKHKGDRRSKDARRDVRREEW